MLNINQTVIQHDAVDKNDGYPCQGNIDDDIQCIPPVNYIDAIYLSKNPGNGLKRSN